VNQSDIEILVRQLQARTVFSGVIEVNWDGVNNLASGSQAHGLGAFPLVTLQSFVGNHYLDTLITARDAESFSWQVSNVGGAPPAGHQDNLVWFAVRAPD
jgi:hypothetical protein